MSIKGLYETVSDIVATKATVRMKALEAVKSRTIEWPEHVDDYSRLLSAIVDSAKQGASGAVTASSGSVLVSSLGCLLTVLTEMQNSMLGITSPDRRKDLVVQITPITQKIIQGIIILLTDKFSLENVLNETGAIEYVSKIIRLISAHESGGLLTISPSLFPSSTATYLVISLMSLPTASGGKRREDFARSSATCVLENFGGNFSKSDSLNLIQLATKLFSQSSKIPEMLFNMFLVTKIITKSPLMFREIFSEYSEDIQKIFSIVIEFLVPGHQLEIPAINLLRLLLIFGRNLSSDWLFEIAQEEGQKLFEIYAESTDESVADLLANFLRFQHNNSESEILDKILKRAENLPPIFELIFPNLIKNSFDPRWRSDPYFVQSLLWSASAPEPLTVIAVVEKSAPFASFSPGMSAMWNAMIPRLVSFFTDEKRPIRADFLHAVIRLRFQWKKLNRDSLEISSEWILRTTNSLTSFESASAISDPFFQICLEIYPDFSEQQLLFFFGSLSSSQIATLMVRRVLREDSPDEISSVVGHVLEKLLSPKILQKDEIESLIDELRYSLWFQKSPASLSPASSTVSGTKIRITVKSALKYCATIAQQFCVMHAKPNQQIIDSIANITLAYLLLGNMFSSIRCDPCVVTSLLAVCSQGIVSRSVTGLKTFIAKELPVVGDMIVLCSCPKHVDKLGEPRSLLSQQPVTIDSADIFEDGASSSRISSSSVRRNSQGSSSRDNLNPTVCLTRSGWVAAVKAKIQTLETTQWDEKNLVLLASYIVEMKDELDEVVELLDLISKKLQLDSNYVLMSKFGRIMCYFFIENREKIADNLLQDFLGSKILGDVEETGGWISLTLSPVVIPLLLDNYDGVFEDISSSLLPPTLGSIQLLLAASLHNQSVELFVKTVRMAVTISPFSVPHLVPVVRSSFRSIFALRKFFGKFFILFDDDEELLDFFASEIGFGLNDILDCVRSIRNRPVSNLLSLGPITAKILTDFSPQKPHVPSEISFVDVALLGTDIMGIFDASTKLRDPFQALGQLSLKLSDRPWLAKYIEYRKFFAPSKSESSVEESQKRRKISTQNSLLTFSPSSSRTQYDPFTIADSCLLASLVASVHEIDDSTVPAMYQLLCSTTSSHLVTELVSHLVDNSAVSLDSTKHICGYFPKITFLPATDTVPYPVNRLCEMVDAIAVEIFSPEYDYVSKKNGFSAWILSHQDNAQLVLPLFILRSPTEKIGKIINGFLNEEIPSITIAVTESLSILRRIEYAFFGSCFPSENSCLSKFLAVIDLAKLGSNLLQISRPIDAFFVSELLSRSGFTLHDSSQPTLEKLLGTPPCYLPLLLQALDQIGTTRISSFSSSLHPSLRSILSRLRGDSVSLLHEDNETDRTWAADSLGLTSLDDQTTTEFSTNLASISTWNSQNFLESSAAGASQVPIVPLQQASRLKETLTSIRSGEIPFPSPIFEYEKILSESFAPSDRDTIDECWVLYVSILRRRGFLHRARKIAEKIIQEKFSSTTLPSTCLRMYVNLSKIFWSLGMLPEATKLIVAVCTSPGSPATRLDDHRVVRIVPRLLSQAGEWLGEQRLEPLSEIRKKYFARAIQILPESELKTLVKVKIRLVKVIDPELMESKSSSPPKSLIQEEVVLLSEILTCGILPVMKAAWFSSRLLSLWFAYPGIASLALSKHRSLLAASEYMLPFFYQIAGQIGSLTGDENIPNDFKRELVAFIVESGRSHPFICLPPLLQLKASSSGPTSSPAGKSCSVQNAKLDFERSKNAEKIIEKIKSSGLVKSDVESMEAGFVFYLNLAMAKPMMGAQMAAGSSTRSGTSSGPKRLVSDIPGYSEYSRAIVKGDCPILTCSCPTNIKSIVQEYMIADSGKSLPKIVKILDVNGKIHRQIVKGNDDLRNDAVLQQLFSLIDALCSSGRLRSYKVVPISACAGIAEWVDGTVTLGGYLVGYPNESSGAHCRYRPEDLKPNDIKSAMVSVRQQTKGSVDHIRSTYSELTEKFQPCMHHFFFENFPTTSAWYNAQLAFTSSVAATSIVGFIVGLGDRHPNNILIDIATGEVVHIDYGICFDAGRQLKIPEIVPFRLTRDMVDGLGCLGVQGPFTKICQEVLVSLKEHATLVTAVVEVFVVDPLFNWAVAALGSDNARVALESVRRKLQGFLELTDALPLAPSAQVDRLIRSSSDPRNLALMFAGWQPWL